MTPAHPATEAWAEWWRRLDALSTAIKKLQASKTANVKAAATREQAKEVVQCYFRLVRQHLIDLGIDFGQITSLDAEMQGVIEIAAKVTRTVTYRKSLTRLEQLRARLEIAIEIAATASSAPTSRPLGPGEAAISKMLNLLIPTTGLSYQQVLQDLDDSKRVSFRGTASELREVLRELLDHLAPDLEVMKTGIKLEQGLTKPTMRQKTVFILKLRGVNETQRKTASDAIDAVEGAVGSLARSVYNRGSLSTHIGTTRQEVLVFKGYAEAVLAELLEVHKC